jgi:hypothetical protein
LFADEFFECRRRSKLATEIPVSFEAILMFAVGFCGAEVDQALADRSSDLDAGRRCAVEVARA